MNLQSILLYCVMTCGAILGLFSPEKALSDPPWSPAQTISFPPSIAPADLEFGPVSVVTPLGNTVAIWQTEFSPFFENQTAIASAFYQVGAGWTPPQFLSNFGLNPFNKPLFTVQQHPDVAMNSANYAVGVWEGEFEVEEARFNSCIIYALRIGGIWQPAQILFLAPGDDFVETVAINMNDAGLALAVWEYEPIDGGGFKLASFLAPGGSWTTPVNLSFPDEQGPTTREYPARIIVNPSGDAVVSWAARRLLQSGTITGVEAATYKAATNTWSGPVQLDIYSPSGERQPYCGMDDKGNAVVGWSNDGQVKTAYFNGTFWEPNVVINMPAGTTAHKTLTVMDHQGTATVIWDANEGQLYATSRLSNGTWTDPQVISDPAIGGYYYIPQKISQNDFEASLSGDVATIYQPFFGESETFNDLYAVFGLGDPVWQTPELIYAPRESTTEFANIGLTDCGFAVAVWHEDFGDDNMVIRASVRQNTIFPTCATVQRCTDKFAMQKVCVDTLRWCFTPCAVYYRIYRDGVLYRAFPANVFEFIDPVECRDHHTYTLTFLNLAGFESPPIPFVPIN